MKWGKTKAGTVRYRCKDCGKMLTEGTEQLNGLRIGMDRAAQVITLLCEGNSIRATCRITGVCKDTVLGKEKVSGTKSYVAPSRHACA
jgi:transposase-like protein